MFSYPLLGFENVDKKTMAQILYPTTEHNEVYIGVVNVFIWCSARFILQQLSKRHGRIVMADTVP